MRAPLWSAALLLAAFGLSCKKTEPLATVKADGAQDGATP